MIISTILLLIVILGLLIFVHELGHFIMAKRAGMKVEEFGFGFPPRLLGIQVVRERRVKKITRTTRTQEEEVVLTGTEEVLAEKFSERVETSEIEENPPRRTLRLFWGHKQPADTQSTVYSINWIPLGGFVKIVGENGDSNDPASFSSKSALARLSVLLAGVTMNFIFAWVLLSIVLTMGMPTLINEGETVAAGAKMTEPKVTILMVQPESPASNAGLKDGDIIKAIDGNELKTVQGVQDYTNLKAGEPLDFTIARGSETLHKKIIPRVKPPEGEGAAGVALGLVANVSYPWYDAIYRGLTSAVSLIQQIVMAFGRLIGSIFTTSSFANSFTGPVGIAVLTYDAAKLGIAYLIYFTAVLSANLAVVNALPFPALDGGRVLFLAIEKLRRKKLNINFEAYANSIGLLLLISLMVWVTFRDINRFSGQIGGLWHKFTSFF